MSSSSPKILVCGSGIAGSSFAFFLLRAYPRADITIVERAPALRLTGASVDIRSNAVDIIKWAGLETTIRAHGTNEAGMQLVRNDGSEIATFKATGRTDMQSMTSEYEIFRGALANIFIAPVIDKVNLIFDESVESYEQAEDEVTVTFTNSRRVESFDVLVGADGLYSKIRGTMLGTKPSEQVHDEGVHIAYFTANRDLLKGSNFAKGHSSTGGRCAVLRPDPDPAGRSRAMFINTTWASNTEAKARLDGALRAGDESYKQLMEEMYQDAGWLAPEMLQCMHESDDFYCSPMAQTRVPKLQDGRVVLLGDAGHALPGLGTSLAITGAYVLAGEMLQSSGDIKMATNCYEDLMLPFAKKQQSGDIQIAMQLFNPQSAWGIALRDYLVRFVVWTGAIGLAMRVSAALGFSEAKVSLPKYPWPMDQGDDEE